MTEKTDIDVVILWVDGSDSEWQNEKDRYYAEIYGKAANTDNRFRDWGLMKYWLRSIDKFMPWVRNIYFVTYGHYPKELNLNNPKINLVRHEEVIPKKYLPVFNSTAIEMNIHRIAGLSENFIYFNDDMYVLRQMEPENFFKNNLPCHYYAEIPYGFSGEPEYSQYHMMNDLRVINNHFNKGSLSRYAKYFFSIKFKPHDNVRSFLLWVISPTLFLGFRNHHCPVAYKKSTFEEIWKEEKDIMEMTTSHRFRNYTDVNQWLVLWWQMVSGNFVAQKAAQMYFSATEKNADQICEAIRKQKYDMVCINDTDNRTDVEIMSEKIATAFEKILPQKCQFEI